MATTGSIRCSDITGCGATWTWGPAGDDVFPEHSWTSELDARLWADTHQVLCGGTVEVVVTHKDGEPV